VQLLELEYVLVCRWLNLDNIVLRYAHFPWIAADHE